MYRTAGIALLLFSFVFFVCGAIFGSKLLIDAPRKRGPIAEAVVQNTIQATVKALADEITRYATSNEFTDSKGSQELIVEQTDDPETKDEAPKPQE